MWGHDQHKFDLFAPLQGASLAKGNEMAVSQIMQHVRNVLGCAIAAALIGSASAEPKYGPGASDTEIKFGQNMPYSGPASIFAAEGLTMTAYFKMINDRGGVKGRKLNFISLDDSYSPPKAIEQVRRLVESDEVLFIGAAHGTPANMAIRTYLNNKKVPNIFGISGLATMGDIKKYPWTIGWQPTYEGEARIYARYALQQKPDAKIGILYQNDDLGKAYLKGVEYELGEKAKTMIVAKQAYEISAPTIDSQMAILKDSGADVFINASTPKFAVQAIRFAHDSGWRPIHLISYTSASVATVMAPAGADKAQGIISSTYYKDPSDPQWAGDAELQTYIEFLAKYRPGANVNDIFNLVGYLVAESLVSVIEQCGDDLTRENLMAQALNMNVRIPMLLPGMMLQTSVKDPYPVKTLQLQRFDGKSSFVLFGDHMNASQED
jgi:branched-chain amino acid transport system substrate-binding protein